VKAAWVAAPRAQHQLAVAVRRSHRQDARRPCGRHAGDGARRRRLIGGDGGEVRGGGSEERYGARLLEQCPVVRTEDRHVRTLRNPPPGFFADANTRHAASGPIRRAAERLVSFVTSITGSPEPGRGGAGSVSSGWYSRVPATASPTHSVRPSPAEHVNSRSQLASGSP
jgi:hypothetical protein